MRRLVLLLLVSACVEDHGNFPGGAPPGSVGTGEPVVPADGGRQTTDARVAAIAGRLCAVVDVRDRGCTALAGVDLEVTLVETGQTVHPAADGSFELDPPATGDTVTLRTSATDPTYFGAVTRVVLDGGNALAELPVLRREDADALFVLNGVTANPDGAILVVHVNDGGDVPLAGATLSAVASESAFYDDGDPFIFATLPPTGPEGTGLYLNVPPGTATGVATAAAGTNSSFTATIAPGSLTVVRAQF